MIQAEFSIEEICKAVSSDLKKRRITQKIAAEMIGTTKQTIANQLSGKKRFSMNMAIKFSTKLGYSTDFLLFGQGPMYASDKTIWRPTAGPYIRSIGKGANTSNTFNDKLPIECLGDIFDDDFKTMFLRKVAEVFSKNQLEKIEQQAAEGAHVDINAELERFRKNLTIILNRYADVSQSMRPDALTGRELKNVKK